MNKHTSFMTLALVGLIAVGAPAMASAEKPIDIPRGAIGISEEVYTHLKNADKYECPTVPTPATCEDPYYSELKGSVVFRAEHFGEMYQVNEGDGMPFLTRYLPNGFYKTKTDKVYWVGNGRSVLLERGSTLKKLKTVARENMVTTISAEDYNLLYEGREGIEPILSQEDRIRAGQLYSRLDEQVVMREDTGELIHVEAYVGTGTLRPVEKKMVAGNGDDSKEGSLYRFAGFHAKTVTAKLMKKIPLNNVE